jgi:geranylgeranyl reductase family protein
VRRIYDAIVVGSGPGGGSAAFFLGRAGLRVLVLERERLPRAKPCGGMLSARLLQQLPPSLEGVVENEVEAVTYACGQQRVHVPLAGRRMVSVRRERFDASLLSQARAEVRDATPVRAVRQVGNHFEVETDDGPFSAAYLIGADGANSVVSRSLGLRRNPPRAVAIEAEIQAPPHIAAAYRQAPLFAFGDLPYGYLWVFPKGDHLSVGVGQFRRGSVADGHTHLPTVLERALANHGLSLNGAKVRGWPLPIYDPAQPLGAGRALLVGDAARLVDPFDGEGIRFAIKSGRLAAQAVIAGKPEDYPNAVRQSIAGSHRHGESLMRLFYRFPRACWLLGVRNPSATHAFADCLEDRIGHGTVMFRLAATLPWHLVRLALGQG